MYKRQSLQVLPKACPLFVPLVEQGLFQKDCEITRLTVEMYLAPLKQQKIDTLILGCTHYPLLAPLIDEFFEGQVLLIDSGRQAVDTAVGDIAALGLSGDGKGESTYFVSDDMDSFVRNAGLFLGAPVDGTVHEIDIEQFEEMCIRDRNGTDAAGGGGRPCSCGHQRKKACGGPSA